MLDYLSHNLSENCTYFDILGGLRHSILKEKINFLTVSMQFPTIGVIYLVVGSDKFIFFFFSFVRLSRNWESLGNNCH